MKVTLSSVVLAGLTAACLAIGAGCASSSSRIEEYLTGFQSNQSQSSKVGLPLIADLVVALPENELGKPTTPSKARLAKISERVKKELEESPRIVIRTILPPVIIPARGGAGRSGRRLIVLTTDR